MTGRGTEHEDLVAEASDAAGTCRTGQCKVSQVPVARSLSDFSHSVKLYSEAYVYI